VELIRKYHVSDARAARIMFLAGTAVFDASIACFDAKYAYWFIRPPQADPAITLPIGLPPHPSYPSAHSCVSGSMSGVLMAFFPRDAAALDAMSQEASLSRLYGGIHYRFDMEAGIALGRNVARKALRADLDEVAVLP
jgi:membrane-associated phospholipid phosphatase